MREIARRAGVGPATLYRHFPTKQLLATEAFADQLCACRVQKPASPHASGSHQPL